MGNTIITCVVDDTSVVGLEINTVISCLDDYVKPIAPASHLLTLQTLTLNSVITINHVNDVIFYNHN